MAVIQANIYNLHWPIQEYLDLRQSQRLFTAQGLGKMLLYLCIIRKEGVGSLSVSYCCFKHLLRLAFGPVSFFGLYSSGLSFLRVQRNIGCYRVSVSHFYLCEPILNQQQVVFSHLLRAAFGFMVCDLENRHWKRSNKGNYQLQVCQMCYADCLLLSFITMQTWKTSRHTKEALFPSVKVKEWFCFVGPHHTLEVKQHNQTMMKTRLRFFGLVLSSVPPLIKTKQQTIFCFII